MHLADPATGTKDGANPALKELRSENQPVKGWKHFFARNPWMLSAIVLAIIVGVELVSFGAPYKRTGFYLDDWLMLKQLSFGPRNYFDLVFTYLTTDPRVIIRPIEALHFGTVFFFSGIDPIGWRLSNMVMEIASAFFVYLIVARLSLSRVIGLFASLFFLTYPVHDSTHYWAVCSCVSLSLTLYLASLWATLNATEALNSKRVWLALAYTFFALSIYGYEPFLPLCALNVVAYVMLTSGLKPYLPAARSLLLNSIPYAAIVGSLLLYQRTIVPMISKAALHKIHLDPGLILSTICEGLRTTSPVVTAPFISAQVNSFVSSGELNGGAIARLVALTALIAVGVLVTAEVQQRPPNIGFNQLSTNRALVLISLGLITVVASYSIFGLNPEYTPTLITLVNRINTGAAFGLSIAFAGVIALVLSTNSKMKLAATTAVVGCLLILFTITNWGLSKPWEISWSVQQRTFEALRARKNEFKDVQSVVLMNCPRYVNASPVFDGPWDFEHLLHLSLGRTDIKGGVVSERLRLGRDCIQDVTLGFACAEYPFKGLVLATPGLSSVTSVAGPRQFIEVVEREGTKFGLAETTIADWKKQVDQGMRRKKNGVLSPLATLQREHLPVSLHVDHSN